jgi:hypothetical protein
MQDLQKGVDEGLITDASNDCLTIKDLAKAGLRKDVIQKVVNSEALANTPFGPGRAAALPQR